MALKTPVAGIVTSQAKTIFLNNEKLTGDPAPSVVSFVNPTKTTDPTRQWVIEMGSPILLATITVNAAPSSIVKPLKYIVLVINKSENYYNFTLLV